ncbi:MAG: DUF1698 domain-containing protein [Nitrosopumilaceae archaeon]
MIQKLITMIEHYNVISKVTELYKEILLREPDPIGLEYYVSEIKKGNLDVDKLYNILCDSEEALNKKTNFLKNAPRLNSKLPNSETQGLLNSISSWYHTFKIDNFKTKHSRTPLNYQMWVAQGIPLDLNGKSVLDLGGSDGFYSFLCESRGASKVICTDSFTFEGKSTVNKDSLKRFNIIKKILNSNVEYKELNVYDVENLDEQFDIVLFFGIYYHLRDLILIFKKLLKITTESMFLSGHVLNTDVPLMYFYPPYDKNPDSFAVLVASPRCLLNIGQNTGFRSVMCLDKMNMPITEHFPHMIFGDKYQMVGTFRFDV